MTMPTWMLLIFGFAGLFMVGLVVQHTLVTMRNRHGVYDYPLIIQRMILIAIGNSPREAGQFPSQKAFTDWLRSGIEHDDAP